MFQLSPADLSKFKSYQHALQASENDDLGNFNTVIKASDLTKHHVAYRAIERLVGNQGINIQDPQHQHYLGLALCIQQNPTDPTCTWSQEPLDNQMDVLRLLKAHYDIENRDAELLQGFYSWTAKAAWGATAIIPGRGLLTMAGAMLLESLADNVKFHEGLSADVLKALNPNVFTSDNMQAMLEVPLTADGRQFLQQKIIQLTDAKLADLQQQETYLSKLQQNCSKTYQRAAQSHSVTQAQLRRLQQVFTDYGIQQDRFNQLILDQNQTILKNLAPIIDYIDQQNERAKQAATLQETQAVFQGIHSAFGVLGQVGTQFKLPELQKVATIGQSSVSLVLNVAKLQGAFGFQAVTGWAALEPYSAIAMAGLSIFGTFFGSSDQDNGMGEALQAIMHQIHAMHMEMRASFNQVFENQRKIYEAVMKLGEYMVQDFKVPVIDKLNRLEHNLQQFQRLVLNRLNDHQLEKLRQIIAWSEYLTLSAAKQEELLVDLKRWMLDEAARSAYTGADLASGQHPAEWFNQIINDIGIEPSMGNLLGFLAIEAQRRVKVFPANIAIKELVNLNIWQQAGHHLLRLLENTPNKTLQAACYQAIVRSGENTLRFIEFICQSQELFTTLFEEYHEAIQAIQRLSKEHINQLGSLKEPLTLAQLFPENTGDRTKLDAELAKVDRSYYLINIFCYLANISLPWGKNFSSKLLSSNDLLQKKVNYFTKSKNQFSIYRNNQGFDAKWVAKCQFPLLVNIKGQEKILIPRMSNWISVGNDEQYPLLYNGNWWGQNNLYTEPRFHETAKSISIIISGSEKILSIVRANSPSGLVVGISDPANLSSGSSLKTHQKNWTASSGFDDPCYFRTLHILTMQLNNQDILFTLMRNKDVYEMYSYDPARDVWEKCADGPQWSDNLGYAQADRYETIRTNVIYINEQPKLLAMIRNGLDYELHSYDPNQAASGEWQLLAPLKDWSNAKGYNNPAIYDTIRTEVIHIKGKPYLLAMIKNNEYFEIHCYDPEKDCWQEWPKGPAWDNQYNHYYRTLRTGIIEVGENTEKREVLLAMIKNKDYYEMHCFDPLTKAWQELPHGPAWSDTADNGIYTKDIYYEYLRLVISKENPNKFYLLMRKPDGLYSYEYQITPLLAPDLIAKANFLAKFNQFDAAPVTPGKAYGPVETALYSILFKIPGYQKQWLNSLGLIASNPFDNKKPVSAFLSLTGLEYQAVEGNGHCLFKAVAYYLEKETDVSALRNEVANVLQNKVAAKDEGTISVITGLLPKGKSIQDYIAGIRNGEWADNLEIATLMAIYQRPIVIITGEGTVRNQTDFEPYLMGSPIFVYYNGHNHYDALLLKEGYEARAVLKILLPQLTFSDLNTPKSPPQAPHNEAHNIYFNDNNNHHQVNQKSNFLEELNTADENYAKGKTNYTFGKNEAAFTFFSMAKTQYKRILSKHALDNVTQSQLEKRISKITDSNGKYSASKLNP